MKKLLLIDGNSLFFRAYYANQYSGLNVNGTPVNGIYTFANMLLNFIENNDYFDVKVAFDKGKETFRHKLYSEYKAKRNKTPDGLIQQLPIVREFMNATGLGYIEMDEYEADDIVGSLAVKGTSAGFDIHVLSSDHDLWQLVNSKVNVLSPVSGAKDHEFIDEKHIFDKWGISPKQICDLKGLMGDASDNIKGVAGIGSVAAKKLLSSYQTIENLYNHIDELTGKMKEKLIDGKEDAFSSKFLATIKTDINFDYITFNEIKINQNDIKNFFKKYNMQTLIKKFCNEEEEIQSEVAFDFEYVDSFEKIEFSNKNYIYFELLNDDYHNPNIIGIGFYNGKKTYYVSAESNEINIFNWSEQKISQRLQNALLDKNILFETYDVKKTIYSLEKLGYKVQNSNFIFDSKSAFYILNPESGSTPEKQLMTLEGTNFISSSENIFGKGVKRTANIDVKTKYNYIASKTYELANSTSLLIEMLKKNNQENLFNRIDMPLNFVLLEMEKNGVSIDNEELEIQTKNVLTAINDVEKEIFSTISEENGFELNLGSPKQLSELLFKKLHLPDKHKGSTDKEALEELELKHPIVSKILEHRKLSKLYSTYLKGFSKYIKNGKVHTKFNQSLTATGRLSSSDPNLQNISVHDELQKKVRKIFITESKKNTFITFDYSQIELRILAQISKEKNMIEMFENGLDIHEQAARKIFKLNSNEEVTIEMRRVAKVFNFGIVYGLTDYGLSKDLKISIPEAKGYIESYFETFSDLKKFIDSLVEKAKKIGYAETYSLRRRAVPQLNDANHNIKKFGERIAVNMPVQGTAADVIKVAMINLQKVLAEQKFEAKIIAQIHDELIIEVNKSEVDKIKQVVENNMKSALQDLINILKIDDKQVVNLTVNFSEGSNWYLLK